MRVGVDLDGVCYDFEESFRYYLWDFERFDYEDMPPSTRWEFYEDWGMDAKQFVDYCHAGVDAGVIFSHGRPFPGTREALEALKDHGHTIHIVTDRSFGSNGRSEGATRAWLDQYKLPFDSLTFSPDKTVVRTDVFVDDKLQNYDALVHAGTRAYLFDRPWNQHPLPRKRVRSLAEFVEVVG